MKKHSVVKYLLLTLLIAVSVVLTLTACGGGDKGIIAKGECGEKVTWKLSEDGVLTISGTGAMKRLYDDPWVAYRNTITSVVVEDGVTEIRDIGNIATLKSITLADSVTRLSLGSAPALESISFGSGITEISADFSQNIFLKKVVIKDIAKWCGVTMSDALCSPFYNGAKLYVGNDAVTDIVIPDSITAIKQNVFYGANGIKTVTVPASVTDMGKYAFYACPDLETVTISAPTVGNSAFSACTSLSTVTLNSSVKTLDDFAFSGCTSLKTINFSEGLVTISQGAFSGAAITKLVIPNSVTTIGNSAFSTCPDMVSVTLGTGVKSIGSGSFGFGGGEAFFGCSRLYEVINKSTLSITKGSDKNGKIAKNAIEVHKGESKIVEKDGFLFWSETVGLLNNNYVLGYVGASPVAAAIPETVNGKTYNAIRENAFCNRTDMVSITIPASITVIEDDVFGNCIRLYEIVNNSSVEISHTDVDSAYTIHTGTSKVVNKDGWLFLDKDDNVYSKNVLLGKASPDNATGITFPDSFEGETYAIANYAFDGNTALQSVVIPGNVTDIGTNAFHNCSRLSSVTLNSGLLSIGEFGFSGCALTEITLPNTLKDIYGSAFGGNKLQSVVIPDSVEWVGKHAFAFNYGVGTESCIKSITVTSTGWVKMGESFSGTPVDLSNPKNNVAIFTDINAEYTLRRQIG